jgi:formylglycine-generating enzyme required for sulfatase activity
MNNSGCQSAGSAGGDGGYSLRAAHFALFPALVAILACAGGGRPAQTFAQSPSVVVVAPVKHDPLPRGTTILDPATWPKAEGLFSSAYICFVLDAPEGAAWDVRTTAATALQTVTTTVLADGDCAAGRALAIGGIKAGWPAKLAGGAYLVHIRSLGKSDPVTLVATDMTTSGPETLAGLATLPPGPLKPEKISLQAVAVAEQVPDVPLSASVISVSFAEAPPAGSTIRDCADICPEMVVIPVGSFSMGSSSAETGRTANEGPRHDVTFAKPFALARRETSFAEWDACVADGGCPEGASDNGWGRSRRPAINVSWSAASGYAEWLSRKTGEKYFLPSEAEWEYAARAGTITPWQTGAEIIADDANIQNQFQQTVPVGSFPANAFGLYDMHGNVAEWTQDCEDIGYFGVPLDGGVAVSTKCDARMVRGGSFESQAEDVRAARRVPTAIEARVPTIGFRVARALVPAGVPEPPVKPEPAVVLAAVEPVRTVPVGPETPTPVASPATTPVPASPVSAQMNAAQISASIDQETKKSAEPVAPVPVAAKPPASATPKPVPAVAQTVKPPAPVAPVAKPAPVPAKPPVTAAKAPAAVSTSLVAAPPQSAAIARIRGLRKQGLESIQRGNVDTAISLLSQASHLAKGTDLAELLTLDLERARKIKSAYTQKK